MRTYMIATIGGALAVAVGVVCWGTPKRAPGHKPEGRSEIVQSSDSEVALIAARSRAKREIAFRVARERISLLEAAELFRGANGPDGLDHLHRVMSGETIQEKLCQQVIIYVKINESEAAGPEREPEGAAYSAVLADEFERHRAAGYFAQIH